MQTFQRNYISDVRRCAEMERKLTYMQDEMLKDKIYTPKLRKDPKALQPNEMTMYEVGYILYGYLPKCSTIKN